MADLPEPLTPSDCDLQAFPFMPLHVARLRDSDLAATADPEACWYAVLLWAASWHQIPAASVPDDDAVLARLCGLGRDIRTFKKHRDGALHGFIKCSDGRLYHPVVAEQAIASWEGRANFKERRSAEAERQARWREEQKRLCERLRNLGITPPQKASKATLHDLLMKHDEAYAASNAANGNGRNGVTPDVTYGVTDGVTPVMPKRGTGTGTGSLFPLPNGNGVDTEPPGAAEALPDPEKVMFDGAVAILRAAGKSEAAARTMAGKWKRDFGAEAVISALAAAKREGAVDPVSFVTACLRRRAQDDRFTGGSVPTGMPC